MKKIIAAALSAIMVLTLGTVSASADKTLFSVDDMTLVSEWTTNDGDGLFSVNKVWISETEPFTPNMYATPGAIEKFAEDPDFEAKIGEGMTLVEEERIDDGDLYYIDRTWISDEEPSSSYIDYESRRLSRTREIFLNDNPEGIMLACIFGTAVFCRNKEKNDVKVAEHDCFAYSCIEQEYPKVHEKKYRVENNCSGAWGGKKYAVVEYVIGLETEKDVKKPYGLWLEMNVKGKSDIKLI